MDMSVRIGLERIRNFISLHTGVVTVCKRNTGTGDFDASEEVEFTYEKKPTYFFYFHYTVVLYHSLQCI